MPSPVKSVRLDDGLIADLKVGARYLAYVRNRPVNWIEVLREAGRFYLEHLKEEERKTIGSSQKEGEAEG